MSADNMSTQLNVGELIAALKKHSPDKYLVVDKSPVGLAPKDVDSYRGYYEQLAINVEPSRHVTTTVGSFVELLESRIGTTMTGYKGGTYTIRERTPVWLANYGEGGGSMVTGLRENGWGVAITWENDDE